MKVIDPGHMYELDNLEKNGSRGKSYLQFFKDPCIHPEGGKRGPSTQEVLRACIDRVKYLDAEQPWSGNADIIRHLQAAIAGFEARAIIRRAERGELNIERLPVAGNGHVILVESKQ